MLPGADIHRYLTLIKRKSLSMWFGEMAQGTEAVTIMLTDTHLIA